MRKQLITLLTPCLMILLLAACSHSPPAHQAKAHHQQSQLAADTGVLVVAPDRGFLGNLETRRAYQRFAQQRNAALLFVTDKRSKAILQQRLKQLRTNGAEQIIVLPMFVSTANAKWQQASRWLQGNNVHIATAYGDSYLAVEDLSQRLRQLHTDKNKLLLLGYGAASSSAAATMQQQLQRMASFASRLPADAIETAVYPLRGAQQHKALKAKLEARIKTADDTLVVPLTFGPKGDTMMAFSHWFDDQLPSSAQVVSTPLATADHLAQWMQLAHNRVAVRLHPPKAGDIGVVALVHGADWFWNQAIRQALKPVTQQYKVEYAFSMADPVTVRHAIERLQKRNVRAIVVVRTFSMASSFRPMVLRMLGLDVARNQQVQGPMMASMSHGHHDTNLAALARIRATVPLVTVGGVEDDASFAHALLENAQQVSKQPANETVILVAHGRGGDQANQKWLHNLASLATQMRALGGDQFADINYATWREDWPDKRGEWVNKIRHMVTSVQQAGGRALIVPARINGKGPAKRYLHGLQYGWSEGFAQTPWFAKWFEKTVKKGARQLTTSQHATSPHTTSQHAQ